MKVSRLIAPLRARSAAVAETLLVPLGTMAAGFWLNPLDPLFTRTGGFPWSWLMIVLLALRYGPASGLTGAILLFGGWFGFQQMGVPQGAFPKVYFLGGLLSVMLCGEFASIWQGRVRRADAMQLYLDQRLEYLTHQHYLLRISHDRLEQDLISRPVTMRDALTNLRAIAVPADGQDEAAEPLPGAQHLLRLLAQYCQLERAALHATTSDEPSGIVREAAARIGTEFELGPADPMIAYALEKRRLSHLQMSAEGGAGKPKPSDGSRYLVVAPLATQHGALRGLLVVEQLPFFALHDDMLQMLNLLVGYYADSLDARAIAHEVMHVMPACPLEFAFELSRLARLRDDAGVTSALVALSFAPQPGFDDLPLLIRRQQRALDVTWLIERPERSFLLTLMPLAGESAVEGYFNRIEEWLMRNRETGFAQAGVSSHVFMVRGDKPTALLKNVMIGCNVPDEAWSLRAAA